jgi:superfamily II DNA or RNA helicase
LGTNALLTFFGGVLEPRYTLADAVRDGVLTRYFYRPHVVDLAADEIIAWRDLTTQLARLQARLAAGGADPSLENRAKHLLMQRAHIIKQARAKVSLAEQVLQAEYQGRQRWIVYCDDQAQLNSVSARLTNIGIPNSVFHSQMTGDRAETLRWLDRDGGVVIAIKCLDEGVDVPSVTHALILASSKNPREFIQRRGRVLRRAENKALAFVHDAIVVPPAPATPDEKAMDAIAIGELARAIEFAMGADNPASAADLHKIAIDVGLEWQAVASNGVEDAD